MGQRRVVRSTRSMAVHSPSAVARPLVALAGQVQALAADDLTAPHERLQQLPVVVVALGGMADADHL